MNHSAHEFIGIIREATRRNGLRLRAESIAFYRVAFDRFKANPDRFARLCYQEAGMHRQSGRPPHMCSENTPCRCND